MRELLEALRAHGHPISRDELRLIVETSDKQRFALDDARDRIRANQGHTVRDGVSKGDRHDVHLSPDEKTADQVGARRGEHVVLRIDAASMAADGHEFRRSDNGVWLIDHVPASHIDGPAVTPTAPDRP